MRIDINECMASYDGKALLADLANYRNVDSFLMALIHGETASSWLDVKVRFGEKNYKIVYCGQVEPDAEKNIKALKRHIHAGHKNIPNDDMRIKADGFESELFIDLMDSDKSPLEVRKKAQEYCNLSGVDLNNLYKEARLHMFPLGRDYSTWSDYYNFFCDKVNQYKQNHPGK